MRISDWSSDVFSSDLPLFEREQIRDAAGPSAGARLVELIDPGRRPNWPGDALDREGTFRLAKLARVVEEYERTPSPTMTRIGARRPDAQRPAVKHLAGHGASRIPISMRSAWRERRAAPT